VQPADRLDIFFLTDETFEVAQHFLIAFESSRLGRRLRLYGRGKDPYRIRNPGKLLLHMSRRTEPLPTAGCHFPDELVSLSSLSFGCLTMCLSSQLTATPFTLPPFDKVIPLALVPHVAVINTLQGNEFPNALRCAN